MKKQSTKLEQYLKKTSKVYLIISFLMLFSGIIVQTQAQNVTVNPGAGSYADLSSAFAAINAGTHTGAVTVSIVNNTTETASAVLNASGTGSASYTSVVITPSGDITVSGAITGHLIDLNGADNVTIDGLTLNGLNIGGNRLTISNTATGASSTLRFINDASNNTIQNCTLQGSTTSLGVVFFSTGTTTGNDGNNINNCSITEAGTTFPINGIYSLGTSADIDNSGNTINANSISDFFSASSATFGININSFNSTWTVSNNKLFQTATRFYTSGNTHNAIAISSGNGYNIIGNTIGYASAAGTNVYAMAGTVTTRFIGINLAVGTTTASSVQGNTITAISLNTSSGASTTNGILCGINITAGNVNVGNVTANTIGASTGVDVIRAIPSASAANGAVVGINCSSTGTIVIQNNVIGGLTSSGITSAVSGNVFGINVSGVATSINISNNTIGNATADNMRGGALGLTTNSSQVVGINLPSTPTTAIINNNIIRNLSSYGTGISGYARGIMTATSTTATTSGWTINNNTISNLTTNSTQTGSSSGLVSAVGIQHSSSLGCTISQNTISNISNINSTTTNNTIVAGISVAAGPQTTSLVTSVTRNRIFGLSNNGVGTSATAPPVITGILLRSGNNINLIANNMISLGNGQSTNTTIIGIWSNNGSTPNPTSTNIYHNSVNIEGTVTSGALSTFCFNRGDLTATARTATVDLRNNIFNNTRSGGNGQHFAVSNNFGANSLATGWGVNASNYNILNASSGTIGYWNNSARTFSGWKAASASDESSISGVSVPFTNTATADLHLNYGTTPTTLESGGTTISGVSTDFDNDARPGPTGSVRGGAVFSDIGADEFDAIILDVMPPLVVYTPLQNSCNAGARTLTTTITDLTGVPRSGSGLPVAYFKINSGAYTASTGTWVSGNTYTFSIGAGSVTGDTISYYIVAQDSKDTSLVGSTPSIGASGFTTNPPAASTPPTTPSSYINFNNLSGTYTVGVGGAYTTLTAAVAALNTNCGSGTVTFSLTDATYPSETFPITINSFLGSGSLIIKPTGTTTISGSSATSLLLINGADNVTIDGSNATTENSLCPLTSASRNLTFINTNPVTTAAMIWLGTTASGDPVTNCTVKNCILIGASPVTTIVGLGAGGPVIGTDGSNNDNISFINNDIRTCQFAIYSSGKGATNKNQNLTINQNFINNASPNNIGQGGIYVANTNNVTISGNTIGNVTNTAISQDAVAINVGFGAVNGFSSTATGLSDVVSNVVITNNTIGIVRQSNTFSAVGIGLGNTNSGTSVIANNLISGVSSNSQSGELGSGIVIGGGSAIINVLHNTVSMQGTIPSSQPATQTAACLSITSSTPSPVNIRNNIFTNTQVGNFGASTRFAAIALGYSSTVGNYASLVSNNNNLHVAGEGPGSYAVGITGGVVAGTSRTTLADWQTETGRDANSKNVLPVFASSNDLHLNTSDNSNITNLGLTGANLSGAITADIDCDLRNISKPDIGADQFNPGCSPNSSTETVTACGSYVWKGTTYTSSNNTATWTGTNVAGCDSVVTLNLTITPEPAMPTLACYETATLNSTTCAWDVTGTQPTQPSLACYETAIFNTTTCTWDVTGSQPSMPSLTCYETASFNTSTCVWDVTGTAVSATLTSQVNVLCNGASTGSVVITGAGGTSPYIITPSQTGLAAGTYVFTVTDANSCTATVSATITEQSVLTPVIIAQANVSCNGGSNGAAAVGASGGAGLYTYSWSPSGGTNQTANNLTAGTYTATVTDANSCTATVSATITEPSQPAMPTLACYETATFNSTTCASRFYTKLVP